MLFATSVLDRICLESDPKILMNSKYNKVMGIITCVECGCSPQECIQSKATECPHCSLPEC